jgi:hypothetical protein
MAVFSGIVTLADRVRTVEEIVEEESVNYLDRLLRLEEKSVKGCAEPLSAPRSATLTIGTATCRTSAMCSTGRLNI